MPEDTYQATFDTLEGEWTTVFLPWWVSCALCMGAVDGMWGNSASGTGLQRLAIGRAGHATRTHGAPPAPPTHTATRRRHSFVPVKRARSVPNGPSLDPARIRQFGLVLSRWVGGFVGGRKGGWLVLSRGRVGGWAGAEPVGGWVCL